MSMRTDEGDLAIIARALRDAGLDAVLVGAAAANLQGAPVATLDIDLLVRDTALNRRRVGRFAAAVGAAAPIAVSPLSRTLTVVGGPVPVDAIFEPLSGGLSFASVKSRASPVELGGFLLRVASLEDVIRSKEAAGRPKDIAALPVLRDTLRVRQAMRETTPLPSKRGR